ncbi:hypothetical protein [Ruminococcus sp.]|uniref:hypothetical protein n=1 Tax=Ruminococcus sp. TaxID=41978 RepID=UPI001B7B34E7|nr:hypothetical protein [Ruminococcus sp.]MBP5434138.1 hypothetical protein [Ruminococcus sp.]
MNLKFTIPDEHLNVGKIYIDKIAENPLPPAYRAVEYLQSTGTQYINTGLRFDVSDYSYEVDCVLDNENNNQMFGMRYNYDHAVTVWGGKYDLCDSSSSIVETTISAGERCVFTIDKPSKNITAVSGSTVFSHTFTGDFSPGSSVYPVILFAYWTSWSDTLSGYGKGKIYSFKFYKGGELVMELIPCVRKSDDKPGMYDIVRQTFLTNSGTGEFLTNEEAV